MRGLGRIAVFFDALAQLSILYKITFSGNYSVSGTLTLEKLELLRVGYCLIGFPVTQTENIPTIFSFSIEFHQTLAYFELLIVMLYNRLLNA